MAENTKYSIKIFPSWAVVVKPDGTDMATFRRFEDAVKTVALLNAEINVSSDSVLLADYHDWLTDNNRYYTKPCPSSSKEAQGAAKRILSLASK